VGLFASPHWWEGQSDDWTMARQVDYYGTSFYPKHSAFVDRDVKWRGALLDFARSFGYSGSNRGFWVGELQGGFGTIAVNVSPTVTREDLRIWTWSAIARGAKGINYYAWYPMSTGYEAGGFGLIHLDGRITDRAIEAGEIAKVISRNQELFLNARPPKAEIAIVYNPLSHFVGGRQRAAAYGGPQGEVAGIERDSMLGAHRALFDLNVPVDFVHADELTAESLQQYRLVMLVYPVMLPSRMVGELRKYVQSGGALYVEARPGWQNERAAASDTIPGMGLHELLGCRETDVQTGPKGRTSVRITKLDATLPGRWFEETLEPAGETATAVATFSDGRVAGVESRFGRGKTMTIGSFIAAAYATTPEPAAERFFRSLLEWAGVGTTKPAPLEIRWLESGDERIAFAFNHGTARETAAIPGRGFVDLRTGNSLGQDVDHIRVTLDPGQVAVLRVRGM
jgi:beta-galactosidase